MFNVFLQLMKLRVIVLLQVTAVCSILVHDLLARHDLLNIDRTWMDTVQTIIITVVAGTLSAGGSNSINMWYDADILYAGAEFYIQSIFKEKAYKRSDSPELTDFYDLKINNKSILTQYKKDDRIQLEINSNISTLKKTIPWQHYKFNI